MTMKKIWRRTANFSWMPSRVCVSRHCMIPFICKMVGLWHRKVEGRRKVKGRGRRRGRGRGREGEGEDEGWGRRRGRGRGM